MPQKGLPVHRHAGQGRAGAGAVQQGAREPEAARVQPAAPGVAVVDMSALRLFSTQEFWATPLHLAAGKRRWILGLRSIPLRPYPKSLSRYEIYPVDGRVCRFCSFRIGICVFVIAFESA